MTRLTASDTPYTHRLGEAPLSEQIERISARLRAQPTTASHRWALFQLMCVTGEWTRAIQQLQTWAKLEPGQAPTAQVYRDLIRAERWRRQVVDGRERPGFVLEPPAWVDGLLNALRFAADGQIEQADDAREAALDAAASVAVRGPQGNATWIVDSDSSFGPVCEVITAGHYRWVPFTDLVAWLWRESGRTGVTALGRKTWATDRGDFSLFELASAEFGTPIADDTGIGERAGD
ncbi:ImpE/SciE family protein [Burkholderia vietnamiensis]|uniref:type VI secretion system accessory protein TagJ n=1 Tax=Burkholderia vietnamiensis TaxID=60552 RepID=UPI00075803DB|nr:type VI secretion system accessory protein TagJ [Burkholderia vietnamiensis]KVF22124.1 ImpE/SciE family protein [Burkholderia vietnamiensis]